MPIAITGGTGFAGRALLELTAEANQPVQALARKNRDLPQTRVDWIMGDLEDTKALDHMAAGTRAIIHVAGLTNTPDPDEFDRVNVDGTANVIAAAKHAGVKRFVFVSSLSAREPHLSRYGASKAAAEELVKASGLDWTIVRPPAVYGPRDVDMFELFRSAKWGFVPLPPRGASSIIHVQDLGKLLLALAGASSSEAIGPASKKIFEPDDGREGGWSHKELAAAIGRAVGRGAVFAPHLPKTVLEGAARIDRMLRGSRAKLTADRVGYMCHPNWVVRSDKAVPEAMWAPAIPGEVGLVQTAEWYRKEGWL
ncbi:NAD-dependent epimerase/dehydratase family protein [Altererythrobacter sp.]|uniref:NAD-dependent epimerase/dehydratase family protein n=1 Tax=Altererythrobacter sp. TaxID=1872480 RepID=UPI003D0A136A